MAGVYPSEIPRSEHHFRAAGRRYTSVDTLGLGSPVKSMMKFSDDNDNSYGRFRTANCSGRMSEYILRPDPDAAPFMCRTNINFGKRACVVIKITLTCARSCNREIRTNMTQCCLILGGSRLLAFISWLCASFRKNWLDINLFYLLFSSWYEI